jgi:NTP pyrophosphatase (non-canonical NTP hydrolase)
MPTQAEDQFGRLRDMLRRFATERDWVQFHSPKNLASAIAVEAAELLEHFQWLSESESKDLSSDRRSMVAEEIADVLLYVIRIADQLNVDLMSTALAKIEANSKKYPVEKVRGSHRKYTDY